MQLVKRTDGSTFEPVKMTGEAYVQGVDKPGTPLVDPKVLIDFQEFPCMLYRLKDGVPLFTDANEMNRSLGHQLDIMAPPGHPLALPKRERLIDTMVVMNQEQHDEAVKEGFGKLADCLATKGNLKRVSEVESLRAELVKRDDLIDRLASRLDTLEAEAKAPKAAKAPKQAAASA
jgi:hypothetical protein